MSRFKKYLLSIVAVILVSVISLITFVLYNATIQIKGIKYLDGLDGPVEVVRNADGIPTITAQSERDLFFSQGYVTAQDRLLQIYMYKYVFSGRFSEIIGEGALKVDRYMRMMDFEGAVKASYAQYDSKTKEVLTAYAAGVNAFVAQGNKPLLMRLLGIDPDPWRPEDNLLVAKAIAWDMNKLWPKKIQNAQLQFTKGVDAFDHYYPAAGKGRPTVTDSELIRQNLPYAETPVNWRKDPVLSEEVMKAMQPFAEFNAEVVKALGSEEVDMPGSNAWAESGRRTDTMMPILSSDPHLVFSSPNIFHLVVLKAPNIHIVGAAIPGSPGVLIGRNADVSFGFTNGRVDQSELYYTSTLPANKERVEQVRVKGKEEPVTMRFYETEQGVLVNDISKPGPYFIFSWRGRSHSDTTIEGVYLLNMSKDLKEARAGLSKFVTPTLNGILTDRFGGISYQLLGAVRKRTYEGRIPVPLDKAFIASSDIPFEELPRSINPEIGFVWVTNNTVVTNHYPYNLSALGFDDNRADRLFHLLNEKQVLSVEDNKNIQLDVRDNEWFIMRDALLTGDMNLSTRVAKDAYEVLKKWDGFSNVNAVGPTVYSSWLVDLSHAIYNQQNQSQPSWGKISFDDQYVLYVLTHESEAKMLGYDSIADLKSKTFMSAVERLQNRLGANVDNWLWGDLHLARFDNNIASKVPGLASIYNRKVSVGGSRDSINCMRWDAQFEPFQFIQGPSIRVISDLSTSGIHFMMPMGESENPFTSRYDNLLQRWVDGDLTFLTSKAALVDDAVLNLLPAEKAEADKAS